MKQGSGGFFKAAEVGRRPAYGFCGKLWPKAPARVSLFCEGWVAYSSLLSGYYYIIKRKARVFFSYFYLNVECQSKSVEDPTKV